MGTVIMTEVTGCDVGTVFIDDGCVPMERICVSEGFDKSHDRIFREAHYDILKLCKDNEQHVKLYFAIEED